MTLLDVGNTVNYAELLERCKQVLNRVIHAAACKKYWTLQDLPTSVKPVSFSNNAKLCENAKTCKI